MKAQHKKTLYLNQSYIFWMYLLLTFLMLGLIWGNSLQPGTVSSQLSGGILNELKQIFLNTTGQMFPLSHYALRKIGHFSEFMLFGIVLLQTVRTSSHWKKSLLPLVCYLGLLAALLDETIQCVRPGRSPQVTDVLIDHAGFCCGLLLVLLFTRLRSYVKGSVK